MVQPSSDAAATHAAPSFLPCSIGSITLPPPFPAQGVCLARCFPHSTNQAHAGCGAQQGGELLHLAKWHTRCVSARGDAEYHVTGYTKISRLVQGALGLAQLQDMALGRKQAAAGAAGAPCHGPGLALLYVLQTCVWQIPRKPSTTWRPPCCSLQPPPAAARPPLPLPASLPLLLREPPTAAASDALAVPPLPASGLMVDKCTQPMLQLEGRRYPRCRHRHHPRPCHNPCARQPPLPELLHAQQVLQLV